MTTRILSFAWALAAFGAQPNVAVQREALKKLDFPVGKWSVKATVTPALAQSLKLTAKQEVQFKNDGTLLTIESAGQKDHGENAFESLAMITYDPANSSYRYNAIRDGQHVSAELKLTPEGFDWSGQLAAATISSSLRIDEKGEWHETTVLAIGSAPPQTALEMHMRRAASFDGKWMTTVSCEASRGALGYSFRLRVR